MEKKDVTFAFWLLHGALLLYGLSLLFAEWIDPYHLVFFCPVYRFMHLFCPLCGGTRAGLALLSLDLSSALSLSPTACLMLLVLFYYEIWFFRALFGKRVPRFRAFPLIALGIFAVVFCILRNLLLVFAGYDPTGELWQFWAA